MSEERDKFLTEAMGGCWHEWEQIYSGGGSACIHCKKYWPLPPDDLDKETIQRATTPSYSTWPGFGKVWEWAQGQEWYASFKRYVFEGRIDMASYQITPDYFIHPDRFADAVYQFLKERQ